MKTFTCDVCGKQNLEYDGEIPIIECDVTHNGIGYSWPLHGCPRCTEVFSNILNSEEDTKKFVALGKKQWELDNG